MKNDYNTTISLVRTSPLKTPLFRPSAKQPRIAGLDFLRGICILLMILDHTSYDIMCLPEMSKNFYAAHIGWLERLSDWLIYSWWEGTPRMVLRLIVVCIFFALSGISTSFSKNNLLRGVKLAVASMGLTLFTLIVDDVYDMGISILFGVLHCFTVSVLLYVLIEFFAKDRAKYACLGLGILFFIWGLLLDFYNLQMYPDLNLTGRYIGFWDYIRIAVGTRYYGADCFGLLPHAGIFLIGVCGGKLLYPVRQPYCPVFAKTPFMPICFIGRNAIWFYLLHQPVLMVLVAVIGSFFGLRF